MEVRREQVWLNFFAHLCVACFVQLLYLPFSDAREFSFILRLAVLDVLYVLNLHQEGNVRIQATLLEQVVVRFLQIAESFVVLNKPIELTGLLTHGLLAGNLSLKVGQDLRCGIELDTSASALLVSLEDHI